VMLAAATLLLGLAVRTKALITAQRAASLDPATALPAE
jgi:hypothetical protein